MKRENHKIVRSTTWSAGPGCHGGCGVLAHIKDGKLVKIEGDPDHPWNQGRLCARCLAMSQYAAHWPWASDIHNRLPDYPDGANPSRVDFSAS